MDNINAQNAVDDGSVQDIPKVHKIDVEQIRNFNTILQKYKEGKSNLESKIVENEQFWKLRHWDYMSNGDDKDYKPTSAWLWNTIVSKHADAIDAYPEPNVLPREAGDKEEAKTLSSIIPVVLDQNEFEDVFSKVMWYKLKQGTGVYGVFWDASKLNGLGDISIRKIDLLNLFWQPGITNIQDSRYLFSVDLVDNDVLTQRYPELSGKLGGESFSVSKYVYDDTVETSDKSLVVDVYYHTEYNKKRVLHYCKYVNETVLYASEDDPQLADRGFYDHGLYPFVFDSLYGIEGSPCGYGVTDINKGTQIQVDLMNQAVLKNTLMASKPRYFIRGDGSVNEEEFSNWNKDFVHTTGQLGDDSIKQISVNPVDGNCIAVLNNKIDELKETSGNRDVNNGGTTAGVTAASAIAAMQEQSGKLSRDSNKTTYSAYRKVVTFVIELIRQFYDAPRQFRIIGNDGQEEFTSYSNANIKPQPQEGIFGIGQGYRVPAFDIDVEAQKQSLYSKISQNEFALQMYNSGFFNPDMADQALACLDQMDFARKDTVIQRIEQNQTLSQMVQQYQQLALSLAAKYEPNIAQGLAQQMGAATSGQQQQGSANISETAGDQSQSEHPFVAQAREQAQAATQPR